MAAVDMFVLATATFRLLYTLIVPGHDRRRLIHFEATQNPTPRRADRQRLRNGDGLHRRDAARRGSRDPRRQERPDASLRRCGGTRGEEGCGPGEVPQGGGRSPHLGRQGRQGARHGDGCGRGTAATPATGWPCRHRETRAHPDRSEAESPTRVTRGLDHASQIYPTCAIEVPELGFTQVRVVHPFRKILLAKKMDCRVKSVKPGNDIFLGNDIFTSFVPRTGTCRQK
jgi:hypothetical protein